ncbi:MAG: pantoate--beta-alanine ligase [Alphaproteobacteria bacterium]|nr:pantoate--beta-alanine ligase [Alphaproteobacteria bacterium]MBU1512677.1 pantoate--beta-alanine ligase [Alphaproteobacteria bacterium]MBU2095071.1 pantoate--beta-alanine ligase [Alphaproteobacteria bacterium]MBU2151810.1 pantoate--beta-alanine ligase [Alphaproteobacteria bacterium]MBU2306209.1 pantoate--beta-alanine ligase [Alphaproteobacteria bacterium]
MSSLPPSRLPIVRTVADLRAQVAAWRREGLRIGFVPTMGALHEGHLSLVRLAGTQADRVVASVFVNPTQFGPNEDFDAYPRDEARDADLLAGAGCHLLFAPTVAEMYPPGASTTVTVAGVSEPLDGRARPGHFAGVATVVTKLLNQCTPDVAVFGEKDFQQLAVIRRLVRDLDLPLEIVGGPTARADDGLALSSRNAYLTEAERAVAPHLNAALREILDKVRAGQPVEDAEQRAVADLLRAGFASVDYVEVRVPDTLDRLGPGAASGPVRVLGAARLGRTRLIDNIGD